MTHSGGKPHAVGDKGQRFQVDFFNPTSDTREIFGWSNSLDGAQRMQRAVDAHPSWHSPMIRDRMGTPEHKPDEA